MIFLKPSLTVLISEELVDDHEEWLIVDVLHLEWSQLGVGVLMMNPDTLVNIGFHWNTFHSVKMKSSTRLKKYLFQSIESVVILDSWSYMN